VGSIEIDIWKSTWEETSGAGSTRPRTQYPKSTDWNEQPCRGRGSKIYGSPKNQEVPAKSVNPLELIGICVVIVLWNSECICSWFFLIVFRRQSIFFS